MRYDHSVRAAQDAARRAVAGRAGAGDDRAAGNPALDALGPRWPVALDIHHEHSPPRHLSVLAGRPRADPGEHAPGPADASFAHDDGINLYILEYAGGARASGWDDVWAGPAREGAGAEIAVRWRVEGTEGLAAGHDRLARLARASARARSIIPRSATRAPGIARAGRRRGFPTRSPAPWAACLHALETRRRARYLGPRQPEDDRSVRSRPRRRTRAPRRATR